MSVSRFDPNSPQPVPYRPVDGLRLTEGRSTEEGTDYFLKTPGGELLKLADQERFLWELLDASRSWAEIGAAFYARFGLRLPVEDFTKFLGELIEAGAIVEAAEAERPAAAAPIEAPRRRKIELGSARAEAREVPPAETPAAAIPVAPRPQQLRPGSGAPISATLGHWGGFFSAIARVFWPIRYVCWGLIPLVLVASLISIKHSDLVMADWTRLASSIAVWPCFWLAEHLTTWSSRVWEGVVVYGFGGKVSPTTINLFLGHFVRIKFHEEPGLTRRQRLWATSSPLICRSFYFGFFTIVWLEARSMHPTIADIALFAATMGFVSFFMCCLPCLPLYGYKFLSILLNQENLYQRAFSLVMLKLRGRPAPFTMTTAERWGLLFMGVGTVIFTSVYLLNILYTANSRFIQYFGGLGGIIVIVLMALTVFYFYSVWKFSVKIRAMQRANRVQGRQRFQQPGSANPEASARAAAV